MRSSAAPIVGHNDAAMTGSRDVRRAESWALVARSQVLPRALCERIRKRKEALLEVLMKPFGPYDFTLIVHRCVGGSGHACLTECFM
jgi:hypothetical protein